MLLQNGAEKNVFCAMGACVSKKPRVKRSASSPSLSVRFAHCHLSRGERPWQRDDVCMDCQGLPLWGSWHRIAMTERASQLKQGQDGCITEKAAAQQFVQQPKGQIISAASRRRQRHLPKIRRRKSRSCRRPTARPASGRWGTWPARADGALPPPRPHGCCRTR